MATYLPQQPGTTHNSGYYSRRGSPNTVGYEPGGLNLDQLPYKVWEGLTSHIKREKSHKKARAFGLYSRILPGGRHLKKSGKNQPKERADQLRSEMNAESLEDYLA